MKEFISVAILLSLALSSPARAQVDVDELYNLVEHHYVDNDGVQIHYVSLGEGPVVLFIHGFPNQWYDWRYQMADLADDYRVAAISLRGYNRSDHPKGGENYDIPHLTSDVVAVLDDLGIDNNGGATIVGHDWGASSPGLSPSCIHG